MTLSPLLSRRSAPRGSATSRIAAAAALAAVAVGVTGCAPPGSGQAVDTAEFTEITAEVTADEVADLGDVTLKMWADQAEEPLMELLVPAYEEQYPNVTVDIIYKSFSDLTATVVNAAASDSPPDLFQGDIGFKVDGALVKSSLVRPLDDVAEVYGWTEGTGASTLAPARWDEEGTVYGDGILYGMSPIAEVQGIYYNKAKIEQLGVDAPASLEDLTAALPVALEAGELPIKLGNADQWPGGHVFSNLAVPRNDPDEVRAWIAGTEGSTFVTDGHIEAAEVLADWAGEGYFGSGYDGITNSDAIEQFAAGDGVFFVGGSWNGASLDDGFGFGPLASGGNGATASPWHISASSELQPAAIAFLDMLRSPEVGQQIVDTGRLPVITDGVEGTTQLQNDTLDALTRTVEAGTQVGYYDWTTSDMTSVLGGGLQEVMAGRTTSEEFAETVQATWADTHES